MKEVKRVIRRITHASNVGRWNWCYDGLQAARPYDDDQTYRMAAELLKDVSEVEDWGCGSGGLKPFCHTRYIGIDGSKTPFADQIADLRTYHSSTEGILLRHVLEHDYRWMVILENAVQSFQKKLCIVIFTPFSSKTSVINYDPDFEVPDISFAERDLIAHFGHLRWRLKESIKTDTQYGIEHVFYIERG